MDFGLKDVHVLVTGAGGGIGVEIVRLFLEQGARVTAHFRKTSSTLQPFLNSYTPDRFQTVQGDLERESDVVQVFAQASSSASTPHFGPVQIVVINHGYWETVDVPVKDMTLDQWKATMSVDLTSPFLVAREYLRGLEKASEELKEKAAMVFIGSTAGKYGEADHADYAACKSAMMYGLSLSLKNEIVRIAPKGRVNCVAPGWVYTPMAEEALKDPEVVYRSLATTPLKKFASAFDVATQVLVLSSGVVSGHVTGQVVMVEGGMEGRLLNQREKLAGVKV